MEISGWEVRQTVCTVSPRPPPGLLAFVGFVPDDLGIVSLLHITNRSRTGSFLFPCVRAPD